jgi:hypothetical protein
MDTILHVVDVPAVPEKVFGDEESFGVYNFNWAYYLESLRKYCETGTGAPFPA